mgnify:FL=1
MVTARDINDIQALKSDEQVLVLSLVKSFVKSPENTNEDQKRLARMRQKYVEKNPMKMDEINSVIEGE